MSALIAHAKASRIIGQCISGQASNPHLSADGRRVVQSIAAGYMEAATIMEERARAECSGEERPPAHPPRK